MARIWKRTNDLGLGHNRPILTIGLNRLSSPVLLILEHSRAHREHNKDLVDVRRGERWATATLRASIGGGEPVIDGTFAPYVLYISILGHASWLPNC